MRLRKLVVGLAIAIVAYVAILVVTGWLVGGMVEREIRDRLARTLDGDARVGDASIGLVRGTIVVTDVGVIRHHLGTLQLDIERIDVDVAPLGAVVIDREPRSIRIRGAHLLISGAGALDRPDRPPSPPIQVGAVEIVDSELTIVATTAWPELARVHLVIERVKAGPTRFVTPLSWIFALEVLAAQVELPGGVAFTLTYQDGALTAEGSLFGDTPITVPVALAYQPGVDEPTQLRAIAFELGKRLAIERARRWFMRRALGAVLTP